MNNYNEKGLVNVGSGKDVTIKQLAEIVKSTVGFEGEIVWDTTKPDGTPRKLMDVSKLEGLGWKSSVTLEQGIAMVYEEIKNIQWN
jgi:GDP-L-fucose synthase